MDLGRSHRLMGRRVQPAPDTLNNTVMPASHSVAGRWLHTRSVDCHATDGLRTAFLEPIANVDSSSCRVGRGSTVDSGRSDSANS